MQLFYTNIIAEGIAQFEEEEVRHLNVLRKKSGDTIDFIDGKGGRYQGEIVAIGKKNCTVNIINQHQAPPPAVRLHIAIAPTKQIARMEWFLEKATEIGIQAITPIWCEHAERTKIRLDRLEKIILSATKQSLNRFLPELHPAVKFKDFLSTFDSTTPSQRFVAHCADQEKKPLSDNYQIGKDVLVMIGPEGDFSPTEIELALNNGCAAVSLGDTRLRTETAGLVACHTIQLLNQIKE